jgi:hypothetical protein
MTVEIPLPLKVYRLQNFAVLLSFQYIISLLVLVMIDEEAGGEEWKD